MFEFFEYVNAYSPAICAGLIILFILILFLIICGVVSLIVYIVDWFESVNSFRHILSEEVKYGSELEEYVDNRISIRLNNLECQKSANAVEMRYKK